MILDRTPARHLWPRSCHRRAAMAADHQDRPRPLAAISRSSARISASTFRSRRRLSLAWYWASCS